MIGNAYIVIQYLYDFEWLIKQSHSTSSVASMKIPQTDIVVASLLIGFKYAHLNVLERKRNKKLC